MPRIDIAFLVLAALCLVAGVTMGIWMGIAHEFGLAPVHAHLNLLGWTSLALFGLTYKAYPALGRSRLAPFHFGASAVAALLFPIGIYVSMAHQAIGLAVFGSLLWLAGAVLFVVNLVRMALAANARVEVSAPRGSGFALR